MENQLIAAVAVVLLLTPDTWNDKRRLHEHIVKCKG